MRNNSEKSFLIWTSGSVGDVGLVECIIRINSVKLF